MNQPYDYTDDPASDFFPRGSVTPEQPASNDDDMLVWDGQNWTTRKELLANLPKNDPTETQVNILIMFIIIPIGVILAALILLIGWHFIKWTGLL